MKALPQIGNLHLNHVNTKNICKLASNGYFLNQKYMFSITTPNIYYHSYIHIKLQGTLTKMQIWICKHPKILTTGQSIQSASKPE